MSVFLMPLLLVLGSYRLTRLVVKDDFPPMLWIRDRLAGGWRPLTEAEWKIVRARKPLDRAPDPLPFSIHDIDDVTSRWVERWSWVPDWLAELLTCPWCASAYVSGAVVALTWWTVGLPVPFLMWLAVWAASALLASREWA